MAVGITIQSSSDRPILAITITSNVPLLKPVQIQQLCHHSWRASRGG
jgi:hypothetical protein